MHQRTQAISAILAVALSLITTRAAELPSKVSFDCNGHKAFVIAAPEPAKGKPWVWYAPVLGSALPGPEHAWYFERFLKAGISIAGIDLGEVRGSPKSTGQFDLFHTAMVRRKYSAKPILLGQSRGGLMMLAFAMRHPDKLAGFAGIYPVCNLASWPMNGGNKPALLADYGLPEAELVEKLKDFNPVDNLQGLLANKVSMFIVHGDNDKVVPMSDNSGLLKQRYQAGGGSIVMKLIAGQGHQVSPSFFECQELVDFVMKVAAARN